MRRLKENETYEKISKDIGSVCRVLERENNNKEETFQKLTNALENIGKDNLEMYKNRKKKWMTEKILLIMEERRTLKNDPDKYKDGQKCIKREIRKAKEI